MPDHRALTCPGWLAAPVADTDPGKFE